MQPVSRLAQYRSELRRLVIDYSVEMIPSKDYVHQLCFKIVQ